MTAQWGPSIGGPTVETPPTPRRSFLKRKQFWFAGALLALILAYLIYVGVLNAGMYYMTVTEVVAQRETLGADPVRVHGNVVVNSIQEDTTTNTIRFMIGDDQNTLPVVYTGVVPDSFEPEADVIVEGTLDESGVFNATRLLAKCASKYNPLSRG